MDNYHLKVTPLEAAKAPIIVKAIESSGKGFKASISGKNVITVTLPENRYQEAGSNKYVGGKKNGCWETWHDNGQKATKGTYADDRQVLTWLNWTPSGQKSKQTLGGEAVHGSCLITF